MGGERGKKVVPIFGRPTVCDSPLARRHRRDFKSRIGFVRYLVLFSVFGTMFGIRYSGRLYFGRFCLVFGKSRFGPTEYPRAIGGGVTLWRCGAKLRSTVHELLHFPRSITQSRRRPEALS